jgi:hypothetical protein
MPRITVNVRELKRKSLSSLRTSVTAFNSFEYVSLIGAH